MLLTSQQSEYCLSLKWSAVIASLICRLFLFSLCYCCYVPSPVLQLSLLHHQLLRLHLIHFCFLCPCTSPSQLWFSGFSFHCFISCCYSSISVNVVGETPVVDATTDHETLLLLQLLVQLHPAFQQLQLEFNDTCITFTLLNWSFSR